MFEKEADRIYVISTKEEYNKVQNELLTRGYKWIDGTSVYYDLYEYADRFYKIKILVYESDKTFEWRSL